MRKRVTVVVALFVGVLLASASLAQERGIAGQSRLEGQFGLELGGGVGVPLGQLGGTAMLTARPGDSGLDEHRGWNGHVGADFYITSFMTAGLWLGQCALDMRDQAVTTTGGTQSYSQLVRGTSSMLGLRVKGYLPMRGTWSPYTALGVTHNSSAAWVTERNRANASKVSKH